jgi:hypothetical protein
MSALALAVVAIGCSSADGQTEPGAPGALRVRSVAGTDLGLAYGLDLFFQLSTTGGGSATAPMVLVKEQPAGAASPILVYRSILSGVALACTRLFDTADCGGTATVQAPLAGTACAAAGRMWKANFAVPAGSIAFESIEYPRWDPGARVFTVECVNTPGASTLPIIHPAVDAGPERSSPGRVYVVPAD